MMIICSQLPAQYNKIYYPSGLLQYSYELKDGGLHGDFISYYDNGLVKAKGSFINNQKTGIWLSWDSSGILRSKRSFQNDRAFDVINEWTKSGCSIESQLLKKRKEAIRSGRGFHDDIIYMQRYWKAILPRFENRDLFADDFQKTLKREIKAGRINAFSDDRFVNFIAPGDALAIMIDKPARFLVKEQHSFSADNQQMSITNLGLGLVYKEGESDKILWLYCPDLFSQLRRSSVSLGALVDKFENNEFATKMYMTTFRSAGYKTRNVAENEIIGIRLAEIDFETSAWIYLLDKELLAHK